MGDLWAVVLAAGEGKRMRSQLPKVLHPLCGRPMIKYILDSAGAVARHVVVVIGHGAAAVRQALGPNLPCVVQEQQLGTGHAVGCALEQLPDQGKVLVLCGDTPLITPRELERLLKDSAGSAAVVMTAVVDDPAGYGRVIRDRNGSVQQIVEDKDASADEKKVPEINTGTYCFDLALLKRFLPRLSANNAQGEYYLTDIIALLKQHGYPVRATLVEDSRIALGINDRAQLAEAAAILRGRINHALMLQGVTMIDPENCYIDFGVRIGADTVIEPQTVIEGTTVIGSGCRIGPGAHLRNARVADGAIIRQAVVEERVVEKGAIVGPFVHVRPGSRVAAD